MGRYIVTGSFGGMTFGDYDDTPKGGVLCYGDTVHVFSRRRSANAAIAGWRAYAEAHSLREWLTDRLRVQPLEEPTA